MGVYKLCMRMSVLPLDFNEILDIFKNRYIRFGYNTLSLYIPCCSCRGYDIIIFTIFCFRGGGSQMVPPSALYCA